MEDKIFAFFKYLCNNICMDKKCSDIYKILSNIYGEPKCELVYENIFQLLISVILSAQCTDKRVNAVTKELFKECKTPQDFINLGQEKLEQKIYSCGFYHNKAKNIIALCKDLVEKYNGKIPPTLEELTKLAGVGRKTANVVLSEGFKKAGLAVDTHVFRVSHRLNLSSAKTADKTEIELKNLFDEELWGKTHLYFVTFGRYVCKSQKPLCENCPLKEFCTYNKK